MKSTPSVVGAIVIILSQVMTTYNSSMNISDEILKLRNELRMSTNEHQYFAKKKDLDKLLLEIKSLKKDVAHINEKLVFMAKDDSELIGCGYTPRRTSYVIRYY